MLGGKDVCEDSVTEPFIEDLIQFRTLQWLWSSKPGDCIRSFLVTRLGRCTLIRCLIVQETL